MAFVAGDVVQLKSGGPSMTVESVNSDAVDAKVRAFCAWFVLNGTNWELCKNSFVLDALQVPVATS